jgi:hypothetical protein
MKESQIESGAALCKSLPLEVRLNLARAFLRAYDAGLHECFAQVLRAAVAHRQTNRR